MSFQVAAAAPLVTTWSGLMDVIDPDSEADERAAPFSDWQATGDARNQPLRPLRLSDPGRYGWMSAALPRPGRKEHS